MVWHIGSYCSGAALAAVLVLQHVATAAVFQCHCFIASCPCLVSFHSRDHGGLQLAFLRTVWVRLRRALRGVQVSLGCHALVVPDCSAFGVFTLAMGLKMIWREQIKASGGMVKATLLGNFMASKY